MPHGIEDAIVEWSRGLGFLKGTVLDHLGEGAEVLPIVIISAVIWWAVQLLAVPVLGVVAPSFLQDVKGIAKAKAIEKGDDEEGAARAVSETVTDIGVRTVALVFSTCVSYGAVRLTCDPPPQFEQEPFASSAPYATFYCAIAAGYFVWDVIVSVYYRYGAEFLGHAVIMLMVEMIALHPFNQYIMSFSHLFELSSPFMSLRHILIAGGRTKSIFFTLNQLIFGLVFLFIRILYGYYKTFEYVSRQLHGIFGSEAAIAKMKGPMFVPVAWVTIALSISLCALNGVWLKFILQKAMGGGSKPKPKKED